MLLGSARVKAVRRMLMKLSPAMVNFTNIFGKALTHIDLKSAKNTAKSIVNHFALLGSTHVKAVREHVGKIDPYKEQFHQ